jgi:bacillithiol biosynthesis cysteine-adding enzyme BshC
VNESTARVAMPAAPPDGVGFAADWALARASAMSFLPRHPTRAPAWSERIAEVARLEPARDALQRAQETAVRLGADAIGIAAAGALAQGEAICVVTGQQPGLFGGPLYSLYKAWTGVALARRLESRFGRHVVPVFWNAADDSDFAEIASAVLPDPSGRLVRYALDGGDLPSGGMVGDLGTAGTARAIARAEPDLRGWPEWPRFAERVGDALSRADDHGECAAAMLYALLPGTGLVVIDARWPELRRAAAPLLRRYADRRDEAGACVREAGARLEAAGYGIRIAHGSTEQALFDSRDGRRLPFAGDDDELRRRIDSAPETLSPNVMLRPLVQDSLLPNVATVAGPGEVAYHAQLAPLYERLGVDAPVLFPRFEATLVPQGVVDLAERHGADVVDLVRQFDATMKETASRALPAPLREALDALDRRLDESASAARDASAVFDDSLIAAVDDMVRRCRDANARLREKAVQAARAAETRRDPALRHYRELLRPRGLPQERVLAALTVALVGIPDGWESAVNDHVESVERGGLKHHFFAFRLRPEAAS